VRPYGFTPRQHLRKRFATSPDCDSSLCSYQHHRYLTTAAIVFGWVPWLLVLADYAASLAIAWPRI
jgi:hypothetical protein